MSNETDATFSAIPGVLLISAKAVSPTTNVRVPGARLVLLDGVRTLKSVAPDYKGDYYVQWITIRDGIEYIVTFETKPPDDLTLSNALTAMITSWQWKTAAA